LSKYTYKGAGVDIDAGAALVERIAPIAARTRRSGVLGALGGFGALFEIPSGYRHPVLVSGTDGVGTKLRLAIDLDRVDGVGIDLVAMCANDLLVTGADPLFFLDYYATAQLDVEVAARVIEGIAKGCEHAGCALIGGETAEMPDMYAPGDFDLAGFCVGIVEATDIIDGHALVPGDVLLALPSSGPHSNGYSLIRRVIGDLDVDLGEQLDGRSIGDWLLEPTRLYRAELAALRKTAHIKGVCHITGGGFVENVPRMLPRAAAAAIDLSSWRQPAIFDWLRQTGNIEPREMLRTFNCGAGMLVAVAATDGDACITALHEDLGIDAWIIGDIRRREHAAITF